MAAKEDIYRPQVAPGGTATLGGASAEAFGAGVGQALDHAGARLEGAALQAHRLELERQREVETAETAMRLSQLGAVLDRDATELKLSTTPAGGAGYTDGILGSHRKRSEEVLAGITHPHVRREAEVRLADMAARLQSDGSTFEAGARVAKQFGDAEQTMRVANNRVRATDDPNILFEEQANLTFLASSLRGPPGKVEEWAAGQRSNLWENFVRGQGPQRAKDILSSGAARDYLTPEAVDRLTNRNESDLRREAAAEQARISQAQAVVRSQVEMVRTRQANGEVLPDAELTSVQQTAGSLALPKEEYDVAAIRVRNNVNRETEDWKPEEYDRRIGELQTILPEKRSADEAVALDQLLTIRDARVKEYNDNPGRRASRLGNPEPEFNWDDPASLARHTQWARGVAADTRRPAPVLPEQEALRLTELIGQGPAQRREAAEMLMRLADVGAIQAAAHKIAPHDEAFKIAIRMATLPRVGPLRMRDALNGPDALKANPGVWTGSKAGEPSGKDDATTIFAEETAVAFKGLPEAYRAGVFETAKNLYASYTGRAGATSFDEGLYRRALLDAIGAVGVGERLTGGLVRWGPGDKGQRVVVPTGMRPADMETLFYRSGPKDLVGASNGLPLHSDGRQVQLGEIRRFLPVAIRDGVYVFETGSGFLPRKGGGRWELDFNKLARRR